MKPVSIREVLTHPEKCPKTWFYLPPDTESWNLDTSGCFSLDSADFPPDSDAYLPKQVNTEGWIETLASDEIEDVVENAKEQLGSTTTTDKLFNAFVFYYENDAFILF